MRSSLHKRGARAKRPLRSGWDAVAATAVDRVVAAGVEGYDRLRHLPRLLPIAPADLADDSVTARRRIVARLARALRAERNRGRAGHWTYDLNRHIGLSQAYSAERRRLGSPPPGGPSSVTPADAEKAETATDEAGGGLKIPGQG